MDKYYYTNSQKPTMLNKFGLALSGNLNEDTNEQLGGAYFENESLILLWLGKLKRPLPLNEGGTPVEGAEPEHKRNGANHFNVRFKSGPTPKPSGVTEIEPVTPDYVFA